LRQWEKFWGKSEVRAGRTTKGGRGGRGENKGFLKKHFRTIKTRTVFVTGGGGAGDGELVLRRYKKKKIIGNEKNIEKVVEGEISVFRKTSDRPGGERENGVGGGGRRRRMGKPLLSSAKKMSGSKQ